MHLFSDCWVVLTQLFSILTLQTSTDPGGSSMQHPVLPIVPVKHEYPIFDPPDQPEYSTFTCSYPSLPDYELCSSHADRGCWLRPKDPASYLPSYTIFTDYENIFPEGVTRRYSLTASEMALSPDGVVNTEGKVFNKQYPGPWIEACWGDWIEVTVTNDLTCNGTTVHWHGIRMFNTVEYDGVNAITQCPIAPGESYTYKFRAMQYGSSWYHSHYSLQYADGLLGPLTIHGPSSKNYDSAKDPILVTDWNHRSAFEDWAYSLSGGPRPLMTSILLNGTGRYTPIEGALEEKGLVFDAEPAPLYSTTFQKGVRYLLRLINTSVDTTFVFSIDGHNMTVVGMDFVPIEPYTNSSVLIGIGQRYHVVVEATPLVHYPDENYWIRVVPATGCSSFRGSFDTKVGILRYDPLSTLEPESESWDFAIKCSDETYTSLVPILPWTITNDTLQDKNLFVSFRDPGREPYYPEHGINRWQLHEAPMWLNYSAPTVLHLDAPQPPAPELVVITQNAPEGAWIELLITGAPMPGPGDPGPGPPPRVAHPMHLHGHDFALLAQSEQEYTEEYAYSIIKRNNPPRRDVALLPAGGFLIIAFKADNPGVWLMHCHIAWHASSGLAMQLIENKDRIKFIDEHEMERQCQKWEEWYAKRLEGVCAKYHPFQDDSGI